LPDLSLSLPDSDYGRKVRGMPNPVKQILKYKANMSDKDSPHGKKRHLPSSPKKRMKVGLRPRGIS
jgi:hypothetical protein